MDHRPKSGAHGSDSDDVLIFPAPILAAAPISEIPRPILVRLRTDFCPNAVNLGPISTKFGRARPHLSRFRPVFGHMLAMSVEFPGIWQGATFGIQRPLSVSVSCFGTNLVQYRPSGRRHGPSRRGERRGLRRDHAALGVAWGASRSCRPCDPSSAPGPRNRICAELGFAMEVTLSVRTDDAAIPVQTGRHREPASPIAA